MDVDRSGIVRRERVIVPPIIGLPTVRLGDQQQVARSFVPYLKFLLTVGSDHVGNPFGILKEFFNLFNHRCVSVPHKDMAMLMIRQSPGIAGGVIQLFTPIVVDPYRKQPRIAQ